MDRKTEYKSLALVLSLALSGGFASALQPEYAWIFISGTSALGIYTHYDLVLKHLVKK